MCESSLFSMLQTTIVLCINFFDNVVNIVTASKQTDFANIVFLKSSKSMMKFLQNIETSTGICFTKQLNDEKFNPLKSKFVD